MTLRPYQTSTRDHALAAWRADLRPLNVLPTGAGKTVIAASMMEACLAQYPDARAAFIVHRQELIEQTAAKFDQWGIPYGVIWGSDLRRLDYRKPVQICSIQTLANRLDLDFGFTHLMYDEAHHLPAATWKRLSSAFPAARSTGFTATPDGRADGKRLGNMFDVMIVGATMRGLIADGYLCQPLYVRAEPTGMVEELDDEAAGQRASGYRVIGNVLDAWLRYGRDRITAVACYTVHHAKTMTERFRSAGIRAETVWGDMDAGERRAILGDGQNLGRLGRGETQVVCAVNVLNEGFDCPPISCVVMARRYGSVGAYVQVGGRGARVWPGKQDFLVIDHGENWRRHGPLELVREFQLHDDPRKECAVREAGERGDMGMARRVIEESARFVSEGSRPELFAASVEPEVIQIPKGRARVPWRVLRS